PTSPRKRGEVSLCTVREGFKVISAYPRAALPIVYLFAAVCLVVAGGSACSAGDVKAGRAKALMCQACHGLDGLSKTPDAPNIAGQTEPYIALQLAAFKAGTRKSETMNVVSST